MLTTTFNIAVSAMRHEAYWAALQMYSIDAVTWACIEAVKEAEHFPVPLTLRCLAQHYQAREAAVQQQRARAHLPARTETTDTESLEALRAIRRQLGDLMSLPLHPAYSAPLRESPDARRSALREQIHQLLARHTEKGA
jgi:hypothetical protein